MASTTATTVAEYLESLSEERRTVLETVRETLLKHLPQGYVETLRWGMIVYEIPLERYPKTYNGEPLTYMALAAQKQYYALYLMCVYQDPHLDAYLKDEYQKRGLRLDMGKSCLRFKKLSNLPLDVVSTLAASTPPEAFIERYEASRHAHSQGSRRS